MDASVAPPAHPLLERDGERAAIAGALDAARAGEGGVILIEGPPGIGKTRLLREACADAEERGLNILRARGGELEGGFAFGIVRQLFEPAVAAADPKRRRSLFEGAAGLAQPLLDPSLPPEPAPPGDPSFAPLHGLYWLGQGMATEEPLALVVDDAHWADEPSLRFLSFLARRIDELPIVLCIAVRPDEAGAGKRLLAALAAEPAAWLLRPRALSEQAVAAMLAELLGEEPAESFAVAVHTATLGNPFYLRELVRMLAAGGLDPGDAAAAATVRKLVPEAISDALVVRLGRLSAQARAIARAAAVLGDPADPDIAAGLAALDRATARPALTELVDAGILEGERPLRFAHPIVRSSIYANLAGPEREGLHHEAARSLADAGADPERIASHLLAVPPSGDAGVVEALSAAARQALTNGAPEAAATYGARALAEPPSAEQRVPVLVELSTAEALSRGPAAADHLREALELTEDPVGRGELAHALARLMTMSGQVAQGQETLLEAIEELGEREPELRLRLESEAMATAHVAPSMRGGVEALLSRSPPDPRTADTPAGRRLLAMFAIETVHRGTADRAGELATRALDDGTLLAEETSDSLMATLAANALMFADRFEEAHRAHSAALADAQARGSTLGVHTACYFRGACSYLWGRIPDAVADARRALDVGREYGWFVSVPPAAALLAHALIERADLTGAREVIDEVGGDERVVHSVLGDFIALAAARLTVLEGRVREGADELLTVGRRWEEAGFTVPVIYTWRTEAALALAQLEERDQAREVLEVDLDWARRYGAPRLLGVALRVAGTVEGGDDGLVLLEEAVSVLEGSQAHLARAYAQVDYGAALRRSGRRSQGLAMLRRGLDLSDRCGATALAERARQEVVVAGGRPRRARLSGVEALTASERRVAQLAGEGLSNRDIAQRLFITLRTVERHLTNAYDKLEISSREELPEELSRGPT